MTRTESNVCVSCFVVSLPFLESNACFVKCLHWLFRQILWMKLPEDGLSISCVWTLPFCWGQATNPRQCGAKASALSTSSWWSWTWAPCTSGGDCLGWARIRDDAVAEGGVPKAISWPSYVSCSNECCLICLIRFVLYCSPGVWVKSTNFTYCSFPAGCWSEQRTEAWSAGGFWRGHANDYLVFLALRTLRLFGTMSPMSFVATC